MRAHTHARTPSLPPLPPMHMVHGTLACPHTLGASAGEARVPTMARGQAARKGKGKTMGFSFLERSPRPVNHFQRLRTLNDGLGEHYTMKRSLCSREKNRGPTWPKKNSAIKGLGLDERAIEFTTRAKEAPKAPSCGGSYVVSLPQRPWGEGDQGTQWRTLLCLKNAPYMLDSFKRAARHTHTAHCTQVVTAVTPLTLWVPCEMKKRCLVGASCARLSSFRVAFMCTQVLQPNQVSAPPRLALTPSATSIKLAPSRGGD